MYNTLYTIVKRNLWYLNLYMGYGETDGQLWGWRPVEHAALLGILQQQHPFSIFLFVLFIYGAVTSQATLGNVLTVENCQLTGTYMYCDQDGK